MRHAITAAIKLSIYEVTLYEIEEVFLKTLQKRTLLRIGVMYHRWDYIQTVMHAAHGSSQSSSYQSYQCTIEPEIEEKEAEIDYALLCFQFFSIYTVVSLVCTFVWDIFFVGRSIVLSKEFFHILLQMYNPIIAFSAILVEAELTDTIRGIDLLQSWTFRGFSYIFIGLLTKVQCDYSSITVPRTCVLLNSIVSGNLMIIGVIYAYLVRNHLCITVEIFLTINSLRCVRSLWWNFERLLI